MIKYNIILISMLLMSACQKSAESIDEKIKLNSWLEGEWISPLEGGEIYETWKMTQNGFAQEGYYIKDADTLYAETTKILNMDSIYVLIAHPSGIAPMIFKSSNLENGRMIFQNPLLSNPNNIQYELINQNQFKRTIKGETDGQPQILEFYFNRKQDD